MKEVLVLLRPDEHLEKWEGHKLTKEEGTTISGIPHIQWLDGFDAVLQVMMHHADHIYLNTNENDRLDNAAFRPDLLFVNELMRKFPLHEYERAARIIKEVRAIKTQAEVDVTQKAVDITEKAFRRVCSFVKPGVMEYEIEAEIIHTFLSNRATGHAYSPIVASGDRARVLHYVENNQECKDGEIILMDFGASYGNYSADLSRTIPVNGKFTDRQKEVYNACLAVFNFAVGILKPGISIVDYTEKVGEEMSRQLINIGLLTEDEVKNEDKETPAYKKYFYHGTSHHLGIDVHDVGTRVLPIEEGMLFTIEPGIYIEDEKMGVRIENNFWVTKDGNVDLFKNIPITVEEVEAAMAG